MYSRNIRHKKSLGIHIKTGGSIGVLKKWFELIFNHKISLRERMFRVVTGICMIALLIILPMGRNLPNLLIMAASLVLISAIVRISIRKDCIHAGATAIAVLLLTLFPISFFTAGGFYSGMPEWFVLCFIYKIGRAHV